MKIMFMDDNPMRHRKFQRRHPDDEIVHANSVPEAQKALTEEGPFDVASLDYDMDVYNNRSEIPIPYGKIQLNGEDVIHYIAKNISHNNRPKKVIVHSTNPEGSIKISKACLKYGIPHEIEHFENKYGF